MTYNFQYNFIVIILAYNKTILLLQDSAKNVQLYGRAKTAASEHNPIQYGEYKPWVKKMQETRKNLISVWAPWYLIY